MNQVYVFEASMGLGSWKQIRGIFFLK